jgi:hypothetical protein
MCSEIGIILNKTWWSIMSCYKSKSQWNMQLMKKSLMSVVKEGYLSLTHNCKSLRSQKAGVCFPIYIYRINRASKKIMEKPVMNNNCNKINTDLFLINSNIYFYKTLILIWRLLRKITFWLIMMKCNFSAMINFRISSFCNISIS